MTTDQLYCCYAPADKDAAEKLALVLTNKGFNVYHEQQHIVGVNYEDSWKTAILRSSHVLVLLSRQSVQNRLVLEQVRFAQENAIKVIPISLEVCDAPVTLRQMRWFPIEGMFNHEIDQLIQVIRTGVINLSKQVAVEDDGFIDLTPRHSAPPMAMPAPVNKPSSKGFFKSILETLNPFSAKITKHKNETYDYEASPPSQGGYQRIDTRPTQGQKNDELVESKGNMYSDFFRHDEVYPPSEKSAEKADDNHYEYIGPILMAGPPEAFAEAEPPPPAPDPSPEQTNKPAGEAGNMNTTIKEKADDFFTKAGGKGFGFIVQENSGSANPNEFTHVSASIDKPQPLPKGKLLYDIPDAMTVNVAQRCLVRIGASEVIVKDDDTFSPAVKIEAVLISKVMEVDMADISEPAHFNIKKISTNEQLVDDESYTEWIFMVTPLTSGKHPLILKVSVIKLVDGKERRKELVFEKSVTISAAPEQNPSSIMTFIRNPGAGTTATAGAPLKDLSGVELIKELDPPSVFISYAHLDKTYFDIFLQYLKTHSNWNFWTDRNIEIGSDWFKSIEKSIADSDVAVLLISANFLSSQFIKEHEFSTFITLKKQKEHFQFLPIFLRDVDFTRWEELAAMQLFVAYGDEYGVPEKRGQMIPFSKLCRFDNNNQLIPNDNLDTFFKNLVKKAEDDWMKQRLRTFSIS